MSEQAFRSNLEVVLAADHRGHDYFAANICIRRLSQDVGKLIECVLRLPLTVVLTRPLSLDFLYLLLFLAVSLLLWFGISRILWDFSSSICISRLPILAFSNFWLLLRNFFPYFLLIHLIFGPLVVQVGDLFVRISGADNLEWSCITRRKHVSILEGESSTLSRILISFVDITRCLDVTSVTRSCLSQVDDFVLIAQSSCRDQLWNDRSHQVFCLVNQDAVTLRLSILDSVPWHC